MIFAILLLLLAIHSLIHIFIMQLLLKIILLNCFLQNLSEMDLEDDKRSLIHREIDKFRDTYKVNVRDLCFILGFDK
jgi:hypothetical protein